MAASLEMIRDSLEEMVQCAFCTSRLIEPKELECRHSFCKECLLQWCKSPRNSKRHLYCPYCWKRNKLGKDGVDGLPAAFNKNSLLDILATQEKEGTTGQCSVCTMDEVGRAAMSYCDECNDYMCEICLEDHNKTQGPKQTHTTYSNLSDNKIFCSLHSFKKLNNFCHECKVLVCSGCIQKIHRGHNTVTVVTLSKERQEKLHQVLEQLQERVQKLQGLDRVQQQKAQLAAMFKRLRNDIRRHIRQTKEALDTCMWNTLKDLDKRKKDLIDKLDKRDDQLIDLTDITNKYQEQLRCQTPRQLFDSFDELLALATPHLNLSTPKDIPRWKFVPIPWPDKVGNLVLQNTDTTELLVPRN